MMERLAVWFKDSLAGTLEYDGKTNSFVFAYSSDYLSSPKALALSVKLPLREEAYDAYETKKFFENMLPLRRRGGGPACSPDPQMTGPAT